MNECDYSGIGKCREANVLPDYPISKIKVNNAIEWADLTTSVTSVAGKVHEITIDVKKASLKPVDGKFTVNGGWNLE